MNPQLEKYARDEIKKGLTKLPDSYHLTFKRMYSHKNLEADINEVVDIMPSEKLDWALSQVHNSIKGLPDALLRVLSNIFCYQAVINYNRKEN